jgi:hypothetical protein
MNATLQCHAGVGDGPIHWSIVCVTVSSITAMAMAQIAISSSHPAYQRHGDALRSMRGPSASAPIAMPPKNAATTANTPADS